MTVAEIIQMIKGLSPSEQEQVRAFLAAMPSHVPDVEYISLEELDEAADEIFTETLNSFKSFELPRWKKAGKTLLAA